MHERAVVADLIRRATEVAAEQGASQVAFMTVRVGGLSHVDPALLPRQIAEAAVGTPVEGAGVRTVVNDGDPLSDAHAQDVVLVSVQVAT